MIIFLLYKYSRSFRTKLGLPAIRINYAPLPRSLQAMNKAGDTNDFKS